MGERSHVCFGVVDDPWMGATMNASDAQGSENGIYFTITIAGARSNRSTLGRLIAPSRQPTEMLDMDIRSRETLHVFM